MRRSFLSLAAALAAALAVAAPARGDAVVSNDQSATVRVESLAPSADGSQSVVQVIVERFTDALRFGVRVRQTAIGDPPITTRASPNCVTNPVFNDVVCDIRAADFGVPSRIEITGGAGSDEVRVGGSTPECSGLQRPGFTPTEVRLGSGDDLVASAHQTCAGARPGDILILPLHPDFDAFGEGGADVMIGGPASDLLDGGPGNDDITAGAGEDDVQGGDGNDEVDGGDELDSVFGGAGDDIVAGGAGNDGLEGGPGADVLDGGPGFDVLAYAGASPVTVRLDGVANDGAAGEGDNVISVESVTGGSGGDTLTGAAGFERLDGAAGNDSVEGGLGRDQLVGGSGNDLIDARDGEPDSVQCGTGDDQVILDLVDPFPPTRLTVLVPTRDQNLCERVQRFAVDDGSPARVARRPLRIAADGRTTVRVACPRDARVACRGRVTLMGPRRPTRGLAAGPYDVRRGRSVAVGLELSAAEAVLLGARRFAYAVTRERGASKKGPRSAVQLLAVR